MYDRNVGEQTLSFGVSGLLWENSLVMVDSETESLWSHIIGQCMRGSLEGKKLEVIPAAISDWGTWKSRFPHTTLVMMPRSTINYGRGTTTIFAEGLIIGISDGQRTRNWPIPALVRQPVLNDHFGEMPVLVTMDSASLTAMIFERRIDDVVLIFKAANDGLIEDQLGSQWDPYVGVAISGPSKGKYLRRLPGVIADFATWDLYHVHTEQTTWMPDESGVPQETDSTDPDKPTPDQPTPDQPTPDQPTPDHPKSDQKAPAK